MEHKTFPAEVVKADVVQGIVETVWAVMGNVDEGLDVIHQGAFTKTFAERGRKVRLLDQHQTDSVLRVLGKPLAFRELARAELPDTIKARLPEVTGGAWARVQFNMNTANGQDAFHLLHAGDVDEWSFGYDVLDADFSKATKNGEEVTVRNLRTLKLWEISPVIWGMNQETTTTGTKQRESKPWNIFPEDEQFCVYQVDEEGNPVGESLGCHETEAEARAQVEALYANVDETTVDEETVDEDTGKQMTEDDNSEIVPDEDGPFVCECLECGHVMETTMHCREIECPECGGQMRRAERPGVGDGKGTAGATELSIADHDREEEQGEQTAETEEKAGRVLAERNADRLVTALETIIEILEDAGIDVPGWEPIPRAKPPDNEGKSAPATEQVALQPHAEQAGPDGSPPTSDDEALLNIYRTRVALTGLVED
jgi:HK97 family phage prohead protease